MAGLQAGHRASADTGERCEDSAAAARRPHCCRPPTHPALCPPPSRQWEWATCVPPGTSFLQPTHGCHDAVGQGCSAPVMSSQLPRSPDPVPTAHSLALGPQLSTAHPRGTCCGREPRPEILGPDHFRVVHHFALVRGHLQGGQHVVHPGQVGGRTRRHAVELPLQDVEAWPPGHVRALEQGTQAEDALLSPHSKTGLTRTKGAVPQPHRDPTAVGGHLAGTEDLLSGSSGRASQLPPSTVRPVARPPTGAGEARDTQLLLPAVTLKSPSTVEGRRHRGRLDESKRLS